MLSKEVKITRVKTAQVAGTTDIESDVIDMSGFGGVLFLAELGAITATAVTSLKVQQGDASNLSDAEDLTGASQTIAADDDDQIAGVDVYKPTKRYVRAVLDRGTANAVLDGIIAIQYGPRVKPPTQDAATVVGIAAVASPAASS